MPRTGSSVVAEFDAIIRRRQQDYLFNIESVSTGTVSSYGSTYGMNPCSNMISQSPPNPPEGTRPTWQACEAPVNPAPSPLLYRRTRKKRILSRKLVQQYPELRIQATFEDGWKKRRWILCGVPGRPKFYTLEEVQMFINDYCRKHITTTQGNRVIMEAS